MIGYCHWTTKNHFITFQDLSQKGEINISPRTNRSHTVHQSFRGRIDCDVIINARIEHDNRKSSGMYIKLGKGMVDTTIVRDWFDEKCWLSMEHDGCPVDTDLTIEIEYMRFPF